MDAGTHSRVKDRELVPEGSFSVSEDVALFGGDCDCPDFLGSREISWCEYAVCKRGPGSRLSPLSGVEKVAWWPFSEPSSCLLCKVRSGRGGGWHRWGNELAGKERLRESTHALSPPPHPFLSALHLGDLKPSCLCLSPQIPGLLCLSEQWSVSERDRVHAAGEYPCVENFLLPAFQCFLPSRTDLPSP